MKQNQILICVIITFYILNTYCVATQSRGMHSLLQNQADAQANQMIDSTSTQSQSDEPSESRFSEVAPKKQTKTLSSSQNDKDLIQHDKTQEELDKEVFAALDRFKNPQSALKKKENKLIKITPQEQSQVDQEQAVLDKKFDQIMGNDSFRFVQVERVLNKNSKAAAAAKKAVASTNKKLAKVESTVSQKDKNLDKQQEELDKKFFAMSFKEQPVSKSAKQDWPSPINPVNKNPKAKKDREDKADEEIKDKKSKQNWPSPTNPVNKNPKAKQEKDDELDKEAKQNWPSPTNPVNKNPRAKEDKNDEHDKLAKQNWPSPMNPVNKNPKSKTEISEDDKTRITVHAHKRFSKIFDRSFHSAIETWRGKKMRLNNKMDKIFDRSFHSAIETWRGKKMRFGKNNKIFKQPQTKKNNQIFDREFHSATNSKPGFRFMEMEAVPVKKAVKESPATTEKESDLHKKQDLLDKQFYLLSRFKQHPHRSDKEKDLARFTKSLAEVKYKEGLSKRQEIADEKKAIREERRRQKMEEVINKETEAALNKAKKQKEREQLIQAREEKLKEEQDLKNKAKQEAEKQAKLDLAKRENEQYLDHEDQSNHLNAKSDSVVSTKPHANFAKHTKAAVSKLNKESMKIIDKKDEDLEKDFEKVMDERFKQSPVKAKKSSATRNVATPVSVSQSKESAEEKIQDQLDESFYRLSKFKEITPVKAVKATAPTKVKQSDIMSDLEITPEEEALNKQFNKIMDKDRFKQKNKQDSYESMIPDVERSSVVIPNKRFKAKGRKSTKSINRSFENDDAKLDADFYKFSRFKALPKKAAKAEVKASAQVTTKSENNIMADLEITPEEEALDKQFMKIINSADRFKALPKKAAKAQVKAAPQASNKSDNLMADLEITPEEEALDKKFLNIINREDRFKESNKKNQKSHRYADIKAAKFNVEITNNQQGNLTGELADEQKAMEILNKQARFKAIPKKAAKAQVKAAPQASTKSDNLMADLEITPEEDALDKKFMNIINREDRFKAKANPKKSAKVEVKKAEAKASKNSSILDVSDLDETKEEESLDRSFNNLIDKQRRFKQEPKKQVKKIRAKVDEAKVDKDQEALDKEFLKYQKKRK